MTEKMVLSFPSTRKMVEFIKEQHIILHEYDMQSNTLALPWDEELLKCLSQYDAVILEKSTTG